MHYLVGSKHYESGPVVTLQPLDKRYKPAGDVIEEVSFTGNVVITTLEKGGLLVTTVEDEKKKGGKPA